MSGYWPVDGGVFAVTLAVLTVELLAGYALTRMRRESLARGAAWAMLIGALTLVERIAASEPAGFRMLAIVGALLYGMKCVVAIEAQSAGGARLSFPRYLAFALLWFGMRAGVFAASAPSEREGAGELLRRGWKRLLLGIVLTAAAAVAWNSSLGDLPVLRLFGEDRLAFSPRELATTALLLPGLSLILHFGVFNLVAGAWRSAGFDCRALFRAPLASKSLAEFWARRWNLGFTEMTSLAVFRPLRRRLGDRGAAFASFLFSGVLHELAISVPVKAGFGLPLLYFALHGVATMAERRLKIGGGSLAEHPWLGRAWTIAWLVLPLPLLFHPPFLRGCFWPLVGA